MAPETMVHRFCVPASDSYGFGILLWELCTLAKPFEHVTLSPQDFKKAVSVKGERPDARLLGSMSEGHNSHVHMKQIKALVTHCWAADWTSRPNFDNIVEVLQDVIHDRIGKHQYPRHHRHTATSDFSPPYEFSTTMVDDDLLESSAGLEQDSKRGRVSLRRENSGGNTLAALAGIARGIRRTVSNSNKHESQSNKIKTAITKVTTTMTSTPDEVVAARNTDGHKKSMGRRKSSRGGMTDLDDQSFLKSSPRPKSSPELLLSTTRSRQELRSSERLVEDDDASKHETGGRNATWGDAADTMDNQHTNNDSAISMKRKSKSTTVKSSRLASILGMNTTGSGTNTSKTTRDGVAAASSTENNNKNFMGRRKSSRGSLTDLNDHSSLRSSYKEGNKHPMGRRKSSKGSMTDLDHQSSLKSSSHPKSSPELLLSSTCSRQELQSSERLKEEECAVENETGGRNAAWGDAADPMDNKRKDNTSNTDLMKQKSNTTSSKSSRLASLLGIATPGSTTNTIKTTTKKSGDVAMAASSTENNSKTSMGRKKSSRGSLTDLNPQSLTSSSKRRSSSDRLVLSPSLSRQELLLSERLRLEYETDTNSDDQNATWGDAMVTLDKDKNRTTLMKRKTNSTSSKPNRLASILGIATPGSSGTSTSKTTRDGVAAGPAAAAAAAAISTENNIKNSMGRKKTSQGSLTTDLTHPSLSLSSSSSYRTSTPSLVTSPTPLKSKGLRPWERPIEEITLEHDQATLTKQKSNATTSKSNRLANILGITSNGGSANRK
jgi:hypothetical protein